MIRRLMASLTLLGATMTAWAVAPFVPWSKEQKEKLAERDRLEKSISGLIEEKKYDELLSVFARVADLEKDVLGQTHPEVVGSLDRLARWQEALGRFAHAIETRAEVLRLQEMRLGKGHWQSTDARHELEDARRRSALTAGQRARLRQANASNAQVVRFYQQGKAAAAVELALAVRATREELLGKKHPDYAQSLNNLAALYQSMGETAKALPLLEEALSIREEVLGKKHPNYPISLNNLAALYESRGENGRALPLYREALAITEEALGKKHPDYATSLNNLASLYETLGETARALPLYEEALAIAEGFLGKKHSQYALVLNNLAEAYRGVGGFAKALSLHREALAIREETLGRKHPEYAQSLHNLAYLYRSIGEDARALPLLEDALAIREAVLGKKHLAYANTLNSLASLYHSRGEYAKALPLSIEALAIREAVQGKRHPDYATALNNLAALRLSLGQPKEAARASAEALGVLGHHLDDAFDHLGERQRGHALQLILHNLGALLSLQEQAEVPTAQRYAPVLAWKGRVASRSTLDRFAADHEGSKEEVTRLRSARSRLARLAARAPGPAQQEAWSKEMQALAQEKEALEAELSRRFARFRALERLRSLTPESLAERLPADVAFVDLVEYEHFGPNEDKGKQKGEYRLLAFVSRKGKSVVMVPLGASKPVSDEVARWRARIEQPPSGEARQAMAASAASLRRRVWDALVAHLGGATAVVVAPDGALTQFPFAALPGSKKGTYLIEDVAVAQVASGAQIVEILEHEDKARAGKGLLALGGLEYGKGESHGFLPGTGPEARRCREAFAKAFDEPAVLLERDGATPTALRRELAKRPRHLHLATHGYFEPADKVAKQLECLASQRDQYARWQQTITLSNLPGVRCGLALSGANAAPPADDPEALPNVLTGLDLEGIDLRGCEVAVLSACQTALGDVHRSQGVVGLQRAFHAAGVRTTVTSLWCVQDAATAELMDEFYKNLWGKQKVSRLEALRQAQLTVLRDPERVRRRSDALYADAKKRGLSETQMRGIKGRLATDLPEGGKAEDAPKTSPEAWWAAFVLCGDWR